MIPIRRRLTGCHVCQEVDGWWVQVEIAGADASVPHELLVRLVLTSCERKGELSKGGFELVPEPWVPPTWSMLSHSINNTGAATA